MTSPDAAVEVEGLRLAYGAVQALDGLSFTVPAGRITALLGPNGAGKTSTVEVCEGYRRPDSGAARVWGLSPESRELRARVGVMLQEGGIYASLRALPMLRHLASFYADPLDVDDLAGRLGLDSVRATYRRMSGGEKQRLALACAVVGRPDLVFLDEPSAGMDPQTRLAAWDLVEQLRRDGVTVVLTTHLMDEAERLADDVVIIDHGRVVAAGPTDELTGGAEVLTFTATPGLDLSALGGRLPRGASVSEVPAGTYRVEGDIGPDLLALVTTWCADQGVLPRELSTGRRSLEDVFLDLTGRELRP
ncbi:MAG TPA: ABC transporter ATP-binding protein [Candidatus Nanopelagicales bacterium]|nr:ABC transporter ATP-binding protein [Candidatus Nanopelagicales bacterium]